MTKPQGEMEEKPIGLYYKEGLIRLSDEGKLYTNQTGGVCCNHPEARGYFQEMEIPQKIKDICWDCVSPTEEMIEEMNRELQRLNYPFRITGGEEAWLEVRGLDFNGILVFENSD